jgi:hypothetical protein
MLQYVLKATPALSTSSSLNETATCIKVGGRCFTTALALLYVLRHDEDTSCVSQSGSRYTPVYDRNHGPSHQKTTVGTPYRELGHIRSITSRSFTGGWHTLLRLSVIRGCRYITVSSSNSRSLLKSCSTSLQNSCGAVSAVMSVGVVDSQFKVAGLEVPSTRSAIALM